MVVDVDRSVVDVGRSVVDVGRSVVDVGRLFAGVETERSDEVEMAGVDDAVVEGVTVEVTKPDEVDDVDSSSELQTGVVDVLVPSDDVEKGVLVGSDEVEEIVLVSSDEVEEVEITEVGEVEDEGVPEADDVGSDTEVAGSDDLEDGEDAEEISDVPLEDGLPPWTGVEGGGPELTGLPVTTNTHKFEPRFQK